MPKITEKYGWDSSMPITLHDKIRQDMKTAMVNKDLLVRDTMRLIIGEFPSLTVNLTLESGKKTTRIKKPEEMTNDDIQNIIRKFVKSEKTMLEIKKKETSEYLELMNSYLPQMATADEIKEWIKNHVDLTQFNNPMQAMGNVMKHFGKQADGNQVKAILKNL